MVMATKAKAKAKENRSREGKYAHRSDRVCECGHRQGQHAAVRIVAMRDQPCLESGCECTYFTSASRTRGSTERK